MQWMANVLVLGEELPGGRRFAIWPIDADSEGDAASFAARQVAKELYGPEGEVGFVAPQVEPGQYIVTSGLYQGNGLTRGRSLTIKVEQIGEENTAGPTSYRRA